MTVPHLHSPNECNQYMFMRHPPFSHLDHFKIILRRIAYFNSTNRPHLSGDFFSKIVDYSPWRSPRHRLFSALGSILLRKSNEFEPSISLRKLRAAKSLFIPSHELHSFVAEYGVNIKAEIIICGNSDFNFVNTVNLPSSVKKCFLQNSAISDGQRIFTLPIGLENLSLGRAGIAKLHKNRREQTVLDRVLVPPMSPTNSERFNVLIWGRENPHIADSHSDLLSPTKYFELARNYKFIFCSEGNGFDSHRVWEVLYQGSFPIVLRTPWSITLEYLKLPIVYVDNYSDITKELLANFYEINRDFIPEENQWLWSSAWHKMIQGKNKMDMASFDSL